MTETNHLKALAVRALADYLEAALNDLREQKLREDIAREAQ